MRTFSDRHQVSAFVLLCLLAVHARRSAAEAPRDTDAGDVSDDSAAGDGDEAEQDAGIADAPAPSPADAFKEARAAAAKKDYPTALLKLKDAEDGGIETGATGKAIRSASDKLGRAAIAKAFSLAKRGKYDEAVEQATLSEKLGFPQSWDLQQALAKAASTKADRDFVASGTASPYTNDPIVPLLPAVSYDGPVRDGWQPKVIGIDHIIGYTSSRFYATSAAVTSAIGKPKKRTRVGEATVLVYDVADQSRVGTWYFFADDALCKIRVFFWYDGSRGAGARLLAYLRERFGKASLLTDKIDIAKTHIIWTSDNRKMQLVVPRADSLLAYVDYGLADACGDAPSPTD